MIAFYESKNYAFSAWEGNRLEFAAHLHHHLELVLFLEGQTVAFADAERCEVQPGDAFLAFPEQIHRYETTGPEHFYLLIADPDLMPELSALFTAPPPESALIKGGALDPLVIEAAKRLMELQNPETVSQKALQKGLLLTIFSRLLSQCNLSQARTSGPHAFRAVVEYCTKNYQNELSLSVLERELHVSKYYVSHLFSERMKLSFNDYVNSLRVAHACRYLSSDELPITEICSLVGFSTLRTFNRAFQKQMNMTPSDYRKAHRKDKP